MDLESSEEQQDTLDVTDQVTEDAQAHEITSGHIAAKNAEPEENEDWDAEMELEAPGSVKEPVEVLQADVNDTQKAVKENDAEVEEDWDIEMDLGKTGGAKVLPSPPANASSESWHSTMAAVTSGFTGTVTRLGGAAKSDVDESWDEFDLDFMSSEETPKVSGHEATLVPHTKVSSNLVDWDDDEEEALNTIKAAPGQSLLPKPISSTPPKKPHLVVEDEDFEDGFSIPEETSHLSLRPLKHRSSKANLDGWGDHTASSSTTYSSEASSFGFGPNESPSNSTSAYTGPETDDDEEALLDGLVLPEGLFDAEKSNRHVHKMIEERKRIAASEVPAIVASPQEEEDFESGLVIDDDVDFMSKVKHHRASLSGGRSVKSLSMQGLSVPPLSTTNGSRPPSRTQSLTESPELQRSPVQRSKSPLGRSWASVAKDSPRSSGTISPTGFRSPTSAVIREFRSSFHSPSRPITSSPPSSFTNASTSHSSVSKESLRRQTSNSKLQVSNTTGSDLQRKVIVRKSSLSSIDVSSTKTESSVRVTLKRPTSPLGTRAPQSPPGSQPGRFNSSARANSMHVANNPFSLSTAATRLQQIQQSPTLVPPTPPGTPSSNPVALRLTMSTSSSRTKPRPALASVFPSATLSRPSSFAAAVKSPPNSARSLPSARSPLSTPVTPSSAKLPSPARAKPILSRSSTLTSMTASIPHPPQARILKRPKRLRAYGDGTELDGIEDLPTDRDREGKYRVAPKGYSSGGKIVRKDSGAGRENLETINDSAEPGTRSVQRRRADLNSARASVSSSVTVTPSLGRSTLSPASSPKSLTDKDKRRSISSLPLKKRPMLIRNLNGPGAPKVVGEMRWNPRTLRWEGNEQVLRDFDNAIGSSTRPALITNLTASTLGSPASSSFGIPGARVVGNMLFDPIKMCWVSQLPPEEEEPDPFADMADDEDDDSWKEHKGGTIRASGGLINIRPSPSPKPGAPPGKILIDRVSPANGGSGVLVVIGGDGAPSPSYSQSSHSRTQSELESGSERGSRDGGISQVLLDETSRAEERHPRDMQGWLVDPALSDTLAAPNTLSFPGYDGNVSHAEMDRTYLHELRIIATKGN